MPNAFLRIGEREQATGEIGMRVALEFQRDGLSASFDPDFAAHNSLHAIVSFAAHYPVWHSKGHEGTLPKSSVAEKNSLPSASNARRAQQQAK